MSALSRVSVDCGRCEWGCEGSVLDTLVQTVRHYNYYHSIQGWLYRTALSVGTETEGSQ